MRRTTDGVAAGGLSFPFWAPSLNEASSVAAALVPILSAVWLAVQIARFIWAWRKERRGDAGKA